MITIYYDKDADLEVLKGKKIAIIGYGSQGHAQAQNLRDSGLDVIVSELKGTANYDKAIADGFSPVSADVATQQADIIQILIPDEFQSRVYKSQIEPYLTENKAFIYFGVGRVFGIPISVIFFAVIAACTAYMHSYFRASIPPQDRTVMN